MTKKIYFALFLIIILSLTLVLFAKCVQAQDTLLPGAGNSNCTCNGPQTDPACKQYCGDYQLNDFVAIFVQVAKIILGVSGSLALLAFVVGGVMFLASAGNKTLVDRGKSTIIGAVIGLVIVFASYTIIGFILTKLGPNGKNAGSWFTITSPK